MSKSTELLEAAVADVIAMRTEGNDRPSPRQRAAIDRAFLRIMTIVAPRVRHFIRQYGLTAHREDAEQVCAIAVHRAIEAYDRDKALFTTFVNWQLRGELQGLRFRLMEDQRPSARKVGAITISLHGTDKGMDGEELTLETSIEDEGALEQTEACASEHLAQRTSEDLLDEYVRHLRTIGMAQLRRKAGAVRMPAKHSALQGPASRYAGNHLPPIDPMEVRKLEERIERDRDIVRRHLFGNGETKQSEVEAGLTRERVRQITRRAVRVMSELASNKPRFAACNVDEPSPATKPRQHQNNGPDRRNEPGAAASDIFIRSHRIRRTART